MTGAVARVYVNSIEVGALPALQYADIVADVRKDRRLYLRQGLNGLGVVFRIFMTSFGYIPQAWFGMLVAIVLADSIYPGFGAGLASELAKISRVEAGVSLDVVRVALFWGFTFTLTASMMCLAFGRMTFGAVDEFDAAINQRIRKILEVPAEGRMIVVIDKTNSPQVE